MENPQNLATPELVQVEVQEKNPLFRVTPLSKYLAMILFVALPFLGFWIGTIFQSTQEVIVPAPVITATKTEVKETKDPSIFTSADGGYGLTLEEGLVAKQVLSLDVKERDGTYKKKYPEGTVWLNGLFQKSEATQYVPPVVRRVDFKDMADFSHIVTDHSCCQSDYYSYDSFSNEWHAGYGHTDDDLGKYVTEKSAFAQTAPDMPAPPIGACAGVREGVDVQTYGNNTYYVFDIYAHEGGNWTLYYLLTDQGYAVQFQFPTNLKSDKSDTSSELGNEITQAERLLASVTVPNGKVITATCK